MSRDKRVSGEVLQTGYNITLCPDRGLVHI